jgi:hypothetical protein
VSGFDPVLAEAFGYLRECSVKKIAMGFGSIPPENTTFFCRINYHSSEYRFKPLISLLLFLASLFESSFLPVFMFVRPNWALVSLFKKNKIPYPTLALDYRFEDEIKMI